MSNSDPRKDAQVSISHAQRTKAYVTSNFQIGNKCVVFTRPGVSVRNSSKAAIIILTCLSIVVASAIDLHPRHNRVDVIQFPAELGSNAKAFSK